MRLRSSFALGGLFSSLRLSLAGGGPLSFPFLFLSFLFGFPAAPDLLLFAFACLLGKGVWPSGLLLLLFFRGVGPVLIVRGAGGVCPSVYSDSSEEEAGIRNCVV